MSVGKPGQTPVVMRPAAWSRDSRTRKAVGLDVAPNVQLAERRGDHFDVLAPRAHDLDLAAGDRGHDGPAPRLDVVSPHALPCSPQPRDTFDAQRRRALALDADAHLAEATAQLHHVGLASRVADLAHAPGAGGGQKPGFGPGDRGLVEVDRRPLQPIRRLEDVLRSSTTRAPIAISACR